MMTGAICILIVVIMFVQQKSTVKHLEMRHQYNIKTENLFYSIGIPSPHLYYTGIKVLPFHASYCHFTHSLPLLSEECLLVQHFGFQ